MTAPGFKNACGGGTNIYEKRGAGRTLQVQNKPEAWEMKTRIDYRDQFRGEPLKAMLALEKYVHERGLAPLEWTEAERWFRMRMFLRASAKAL